MARQLKTKINWIFAVFFVLLFDLVVHSGFEVGIPPMTNISPKEYDQAPSNWAIVQDFRGVMYFGNPSGILVLDGQGFDFIRTNRITRSLAIDTNGIIYVGSVGEFGFLGIDAKGTMHYKSLLNHVPDKHRDFVDVWSAWATNHGVYFITLNKIFRWHDGKIYVMEVTVNFPNATSLIKNKVYFHKGGGGIAYLNEGIIHNLPNAEHFAPDKNTRVQVLPYIDNKLLITTSKSGFFVYDPEKGTQAISPMVTEIDPFLKVNPFYYGIWLPGDFYAFATHSAGIITMDKTGKLGSVFNKLRGLLDDSVRCLALDRENNLWAGLNVGISCIEISSPLTFFSDSSGLGGSVLTVNQYDDKIFVGTFSGPHYLPNWELNPNDDKHVFKPLAPKLEQCFDFHPFQDSLIVLSDRNLLQYRQGKIVSRINMGNVGFTVTSSKKFPDHVFAGLNGGLVAVKFTQDTNGLYLATRMIKDGDFTQIKSVVRNIVPDRNGDLWLETQDMKVFYLNFPGEDVRRFKVKSFNILIPYPSQDITFIDNQLFIATTDGIYKAIIPAGPQINTADVRLEKDRSLNSFINEIGVQPFWIQNDLLNRVWLNSQAGFGYVKKGEDGSYDWQVTPFKRAEMDVYSVFCQHNGVCWFATGQGDGLIRFDERIHKHYSVEYHALIRKVLMNQETAIFNGNYYRPESLENDVYKKVSLIQPQFLSPEFKYKENSLIFHYSAPFFESHQSTRFSYILNGFEDQWSKWGKENKKEYTNISEGDYTFLVKALNIFGVESKEGRFRFSVLPPWYRSWLAYMGYFIGFLSFMGLVLRLNSYRLQEAKKRLERIVAERTAEVVRQKEELEVKNKEIEDYASDLYSTNRQLVETKNALWGEMELAKKIQTVLLPDNPQIPGFEISGFMNPADQVGGDYYDVIHANGRHWVVIGDVSGHGVPSGLIMMMVRTSIHLALEIAQDASPETILTHVNRIIHESIQKLGEEKYMTITVFSYFQDGKFHFSGLHQDILIYRTQTKQVETVQTDGMWIGMLDDIEHLLDRGSIKLEKGDIMLLYTDGVSEAMDQDQEMYSDEKLIRVFTESGHLSLEEIKQGILDSLEGYACDDDVTLLLLKKI